MADTVEAILLQEKAAYENIKHVLGSTDQPFGALSDALNAYRTICLDLILVEFISAKAATIEAKLWSVHIQARQYFHRALSNLRKINQKNTTVEVRQLTRVFKSFLKTSTTFYREFIHRMHINFGGIPELEFAAQKIHVNEQQGEGLLSQTISPQLRKVVFERTHQILIHLGDLARYRASEGLDTEPDYGPAVGFYGLACVLKPTSGLGYHQQAVIALDQRHHLRAIFYLYRAICVQEPHPNAANNLKLEFEKVNAAWDRGELIKKSHPNDPDSAKSTLVGWFIRLQSMCYKGEAFRSFEELEREVLSQLGAYLKQHNQDSVLFRMVIITIAAQEFAGQEFKEKETVRSQQSFFYLLRVNIDFYSTLLSAFYDDLYEASRCLEDDGDTEGLLQRLTPVSQCILPALRIYSAWIWSNVHFINGLANDTFLEKSVMDFWRRYAKTLTLIANAFPIWDLDEMSDPPYLLPEDAESVSFTALINEETHKHWHKDGMVKPRFCDVGDDRWSDTDETLARIKQILGTGSDLATNSHPAPINIKGLAIYYGNDIPDEFPLPKRHVEAPREENPAEERDGPAIQNQAAPKAPKAVTQSKPAKPVSWANIAANGHTKQPKAVADLKPSGSPSQVSRTSTTHDALSRMVDDLVDDDDSDNPITPPQQFAAMPAVIPPNGDLTGASRDFMVKTDWRSGAKSPQAQAATNRMRGSPTLANARANAKLVTPPYPMVHQSVSSIWNPSGASSFPSDLPMGSTVSPGPVAGAGIIHARVDSNSSIRSRLSATIGESWPAGQGTPTPVAGGLLQERRDFAKGYDNLDRHGITSPLLFGAGGGTWSTEASRSRALYRGSSPPNGQTG